VSTVIGGGMVGLPYAILLLGLVLGFSLLAFSAITVHYSSYLYFAIREQVPGNFSSLYEMAYALQGRKSIFIIASVNIVISAGLMLIVYGTTAATLMGSIFSPDDPTKYIYG
jgi:amino acid permease